MNGRMLGSLVVSILFLSATSEIGSALARGGGGSSAATGFRATRSIIVRRAPFLTREAMLRNNIDRANLQFRRHARLRYVAPALVWPDFPFASTEGPLVESEAPITPEVIVLSNLPNLSQAVPPPTRSQAPSDGSIGGCHPIPNGYHCDPPQEKAPR